MRRPPATLTRSRNAGGNRVRALAAPAPAATLAHMRPASRLVLGGHSFVAPLGSDPEPDRAGRAAILAACAAAGIGWVDTTYEPERDRLGEALHDSGLGERMQVCVWNFFGGFGPRLRPYGPSPWREEHLDQVRRALDRDRIDALVVHRVGDPDADARQEALAERWLAAGAVGRLGLWMPGAERMARGPGPYAFLVWPTGLHQADAPTCTAAAQAAGWAVWGTSPFNRGWTLDQRSADPAVRARLAELLLRHALHLPGVERLVVAMRQPAWAERNAAAAAAGPLTAAERAELGA